MRSLCLRSVTLGCTFCAVISSFTLTGQPTGAQASAATESAVSVSEMYDADFAKHVELRMLRVAWQILNASMMTDVALQLHEAKQVLGRKRPEITSEQILKSADKVASDANTLRRLQSVAEANDDGAEVARLKKTQSLAAGSHGVDGDSNDVDMFSTNDINKDVMEAFGDMLLQIRAAKVPGNRDAPKSLAKGTDLLSSVRDSHRSQLKERLDDALQHCLLSNRCGDAN